MIIVRITSLILFFIITIEARSYGHTDGRIIGGEEVNIKEYPYTVSIEDYGLHKCGGTLIASNIVITAAHCLMMVTNANTLRIRAGSTKRGEGGVLKNVETIIRHDLFPAEDDSNEYDIALLLLEDMYKYSKKIKKIELADDDDVLRVNETATITGWGRMSNGAIATELQKVELPIVDQETCAELLSDFEKVTENMVCAGYVGVGGKDACDGDSGGPMVVNGRLHGIVSWGRGCAEPNSPGVFTRITSYRKWIRSRVGL